MILILKIVIGLFFLSYVLVGLMIGFVESFYNKKDKKRLYDSWLTIFVLSPVFCLIIIGGIIGDIVKKKSEKRKKK